MPAGETVKERRKDTEHVYPNVVNLAGETVAVSPTRIATGRQRTVSIGHRRSRDGKFYEGGPFYTSLARTVINHSEVKTKRTSAPIWEYDGPISVPISSDGLKDPTLNPYAGNTYQLPTRNDSYLDADGATAIALVDPTRPEADMASGLGEVMKDGIPSIPVIGSWKKRTEIAKAAGSEFLNYQFGWVPLVNEVLNVGKAARFHRDILSNYSKGAGGNRHRTFSFDDEFEETHQDLGAAAASVGGGVTTAFESPSRGRLTQTNTKLVRKWFSGCFTYAVPSSSRAIGNAMGYGSEADKLFGISLTPDVLWELTPWSWAVDWFSNAGDVIHNVQSFNLSGLVMRYGYMMEESIYKSTRSLERAGLVGAETALVPDSFFEVKTKRRREANPFGFGLSWDGLSPTQMAITAALGITRLR